MSAGARELLKRVASAVFVGGFGVRGPADACLISAATRAATSEKAHGCAQIWFHKICYVRKNSQLAEEKHTEVEEKRTVEDH